MSLSFSNINNRLAGTRRLLISVLLIISHTPAIYAACEQEKDNAQQIARRISREWPLRPSYDSKTQYVQQLAEKIILSVKLNFKSNNFDWPSNSWHFSLLRDSSVNAYSIGNGNIYITDGTLNFVNTEAELAAILAHEMAHQLLGHFCQTDKTHYTRAIGSFLQVFDNNKEIAADTLAVKILQKSYFPAQAMLDVLKRSPNIIKAEAREQRRLRVNALKQQLKGIKKITFSSSPKFFKLRKIDSF
jgi:predicted Zn-dependent protease